MSEFVVSGLLRSTSVAFVFAFAMSSGVYPVYAQQGAAGAPPVESGVVQAGEILIENVSPDIVPNVDDLLSPESKENSVNGTKKVDAQPITEVQNVSPVQSGKTIDAIIGDAVSGDLEAGNSDPAPGTLSGDGTASISAPTAYDDARGKIEGENEFFDSSNIVPSGEMSKKGPVKVNPRTQPASKLVTVTKNFKTDTKEAKIVAAERALSLGMYDSSLTMFEELSKDNPREPRVLMGKAVSLQKLGRFDEAMQAYEVLSNMDPKNINVKVNMLGLLSTRYPAVALRQLLELLDHNSDSVGLTAQIAVAYAQSGDFASSMKYFGIASSMEPQNAGHVYNMAIMADRAGNKDSAIKYYEQALEIDAVYNSGTSLPRDVVYERLSSLR